MHAMQTFNLQYINASSGTFNGQAHKLLPDHRAKWRSSGRRFHSSGKLSHLSLGFL